MLKRSYSIAIALAVLAGAVALWMATSSGPDRSVLALPAAASSDRDVPRVEPVRNGASPDSRSPIATADEGRPRSEATGTENAEPEKAYGLVFGQVLDENGAPLPERDVVFRRSPGVLGRQSHRARSNDLGFYRDQDAAKRWREPPAARLETGTWYVFAEEEDERVWLDSSSRRLMGRIEVFEGQQTQFDVVFGGGRTLTGRLDYDDPIAHESGGSLLHVQLVSLWRPEEPVGDAVLEFAKGKPWFNVDLPDEEMRRRLAKQGKEYPKYELGAFKFSGLRPEPHIFRVILDVKGEWIYEREFDLSAGDIDAGAIPLDDSMFRKRKL